MITLDNIKAKLAEAIKHSGLSQSEIARRLGVAHQQVSGYVCGKRNSLRKVNNFIYNAHLIVLQLIIC